MKRRLASAVRPPPLTVMRVSSHLPTILHPTIPDDLNVGIAGERACQQLECGEVATPNDDESGLNHGA